MADNPVGGVAGRVNPVTITPAQRALSGNVSGQSFGTMLREQLEKNENLLFSKHAQERISQRGIEISEKLLDNIRGAVAKAREKGAKDVVIIDSKSAFIVNVPNNTVITTMSGSEMKDNIFTNIDSAVVI